MLWFIYSITPDRAGKPFIFSVTFFINVILIIKEVKFPNIYFGKEPKKYRKIKELNPAGLNYADYLQEIISIISPTDSASIIF